MSVSSIKRFTRTLRAEMDKLITLPSVWITLICTFILNLGVVAAFTSVGLEGAAGTQGILIIGLSSMGYLQAGFIILGILTTCSEYTGGQIRTTLTAIPWRSLQLTTKHLALAMVTIPAGFIIVVLGMLYTWIRMRDIAVGVDIDTLIEVIIGATGYLTLTSLLSAAVGAIIRRTTPTLVILLGYYFIVSPLMKGLLRSFITYLPDAAGQSMYRPSSMDELNALTPVQGTGILMLWALILIAVAVVFYRKRDA